MSHTTRLATVADIPVIASLAYVIWKEYYPAIITREQIDYMLERMYSESKLRKQMTSENHAFYVVEDRGAPVGYLSVQETDSGRRDYFLHKFYILAECRQKGMGRFLFERVLGEIAARGAGTIRLCVNRCNVKAVNFYFKTGFTIEKAIDLDIGGGFFMNDFVMVKNFGGAGKGES